MNKYSIEITLEQAQTISRACELFGRLHMGQFKVLADEFIGCDTLSNVDLNKLRDGLEQLEQLITGSPNSYHGIASHKIPEKAKIAVDLYQVVRHRITWDKEPKGGFGVMFDKPLPVTTHPLAIIQLKA